MNEVTIALKPKYATRKAVDKVIFNEDDLLTIVTKGTTRYILPLFDTCYVAFEHDGKYYPVTVENYEEQFALISNGEAPTVEANDAFGIKKIENFLTESNSELASKLQECPVFVNGLLTGSLLKVTNYKEAPAPDKITKNGFWMAFNFDLAGATAEGYSELKIFDTAEEVLDGENLVFMGETKEDVNKKIFRIIGKLTVGEETQEIGQAFYNILNCKTLNSNDEINAIEVYGVGYDNLYDAFAALNGRGGVVTVNKSCELPADKKINLTDGKSYTLKIGNNATVSLGRYIRLSDGTSLDIIGNGTLKETNPYYAPIVMINTDESKKVSLFVDEFITLKGWTGIFVDKASYNIYIFCKGTCVGQNDGYSNGAGVYVNGVVKSGSLYFTGSTEGTVGAGMYIAGNFETYIKNAKVIGSNIGIEQRAGSLTIADSRVVGNTEAEATMKPNGNGSTSENCAVAIAQHTSKKPINVEILKSTLIGNAAFFEGNPQGNPDATKDTTIAIYGDVFVGDIKTLSEDDCTKFIHGGHFSVEPDAKYLVDGYEAVTAGNGTFDVVKKA